MMGGNRPRSNVQKSATLISDGERTLSMEMLAHWAGNWQLTAGCSYKDGKWFSKRKFHNRIFTIPFCSISFFEQLRCGALSI